MAIIATNEGGGNYTPVPAGTNAARCYSMVHMGTVTENIMGEDKTLNKVRITWELPAETKVFKEENGEQPYVVSKEFTLSMHEKATLRKFLESWRGKGFTEDEAKSFDISVLLGKGCMLSVIHKTSKTGKTFAEISSVTSVPKGMSVPPQVNENFEFNYDPFDQKKFDSLPEFIQQKIKTSREYKMATSDSHLEDEIRAQEYFDQQEVVKYNDDLPF